MARRPARESSGPAKSNREKIIDALMELLAEERIEDIGFGAIARRAGLTLADCRAEFRSVLAVLAAYTKEIDRQVLAGGDADTAEEPPRERLFDVLMRRLEALAPHKAAIRSLARSAARDPALAFALNGLTVRSMQWMLTAADIGAAGPKGILRGQGLALLYASVLRTWLDDEDAGLARTMAALDRGLARGARWAGLLDELCRFVPTRCCPPGRRSRRSRDAADEEPAAA
ncbi:MAG TPA: TetR/AcrR family transcriptional regulator [Xanthobacteraceae bacterium]|jgi:AcrR family transcriptional regulator|nr:TetR/AcrR family transcriptional regulator [Xanthobacteraceae bacterium]